MSSRSDMLATSELDMPAPAARPTPPYLDALNPEQRAAVEAGDGPLLVLAGAGTGKTRVLTTRFAHLLATGRARPYQVLAVTFTNKAAREMIQRVALLLGQSVEGLWLGTFHALGARLLRRHAELVGLKANFTILDTDDQLRLLKQVIEAADLDPRRWTPRALLSIIERFKDRGQSPDNIPESDIDDFALGRTRAAVRRLSGAAAHAERLRLRRSAPALPAPVRGAAGDPCRLPAAVSRDPGRRVPGHQRRAVPLAAAARPAAQATSPASATTTSRSTAGAAPRSATSCASSRISRERRWSASSATTARAGTSWARPRA